MKKHYVGGSKTQATGRPEKAGNVTKPIRRPAGNASKDPSGMGAGSINPPGIRSDGTGGKAGADHGREIDKPHRIVAKIIPGPLPEGCRVKVVETEGEVVFLHECTDYRARQIRAGAINAGLVRKGSTLAQALGGRLRHALKMRTANA